MKNKMNIVPTIISKIEDNSIWCPTFQLIWNDLKNKIVGNNIVFINDKDNKYVNELNQESFNELMINDNYYYKNYGYMTTELKDKIINDLKNKFNEKSDILERFSFSKNSKDYFLYSMLVRNFKFQEPFDILSNNTFGIDENSKQSLFRNVKVLFYKDDSYAVKLLTTSCDEVILYKGCLGNNFYETYKFIQENSNEEEFNFDDTIKIKNINLDCEVKYDEITNRTFYDQNNNPLVISDALQTIKFNLDNTGGRIKSEAGMAVRFAAIRYGRHFNFTNDFVLFVKEGDKDIPYLAININNIE